MNRVLLSVLLLLPAMSRADDFDVAVIGAGTAGIPAALAAARIGVRTILLERGDAIGGTMAQASVETPGLFHVGGRQVIAGPGWELVSNACIRSGFRLPKFSRPAGEDCRRHQVRIRGRVYVALAQLALKRAGVEVRTNTEVVGVFRTENGWRLAGGGGTVEARQIVDCTGNASVAALCGAMREREDVCQPGSYFYWIDPGCDLKTIDADGLNAAFEKAVEEGKVRETDCVGRPPYLCLGKMSVNRIPGADDTTSGLRDKTNRLGVESMERMLAFFRAQPGLDKARVIWKAKGTGVRETYRVVGDAKITQLDYRSGQTYSDAIAYSAAPIALYTDDAVLLRKLDNGVVPSVPYGCLLPKDVEDVLVAGRAISSDRAANSALRSQATCMATGQAAGVAAALACRRGVSPRKLEPADIRNVLGQLGAIVPPESR